MINENEQRIKEKLEFFLAEKVSVHIERKDRQFWNGNLIEKKGDDVFVLQERKLGLVHLFLKDIFEVDEFREGGL